MAFKPVAFFSRFKEYSVVLQGAESEKGIDKFGHIQKTLVQPLVEMKFNSGFYIAKTQEEYDKLKDDPNCKPAEELEEGETLNPIQWCNHQDALKMGFSIQGLQKIRLLYPEATKKEGTKTFYDTMFLSRQLENNKAE